MIKSLLVLLSLVFTVQAQALDFQCVGTVDNTKPSGDHTSEVIDLEIQFDTSAFQRQVGDIGPVHFFAQGDKTDNRFLLMITLGPDYTRGVTASLQWDGKSPMRVTRVDGNTVYKVICQ